MLLHIKDDAEFAKEIAEGTVLVDFFATWCGPCKMLSPVVEKVAAAHPEIKVIKVDVDEANSLAGKYRVEAVPTLILFQDGKLAKTTMGYQPEASLLKFLGL